MKIHLNEADKSKVEAAVAAAEKQAAVEIVPVLARASGRYDRAEDVFGLICGLVLAGVAAAVTGMSEGWNGQPATLGFFGTALLTLVGFALGVAASSRWRLLSRPFIPAGEAAAEVDRAAAGCFHRFRVGRTRHGSGAVILVSALERRIAVAGDGPLAERLGQDDWNAVRDAALAHLRAGHLAEALAAAAEELARRAAPHFPLGPDDADELPGTLRFLD